MNKVILTGRITKDPELRYTQNGMATLTFTVDRFVQAMAQDKQILLTVLLGASRQIL